MSYVVRDVVVVLGLAVVAAYFSNLIVWPLYWIAQGTMFWALFVLGHDCGHGSFSNNHKLNSVMGHLLHSSILVPYHGWRISHKTHHQNHGHVENDELWHPKHWSQGNVFASYSGALVALCELSFATISSETTGATTRRSVTIVEMQKDGTHAEKVCDYS